MKKRKKLFDTKLATHKTSQTFNSFYTELLNTFLLSSKHIFNSYLYHANFFYKFKFFLYKNYDGKSDFIEYCNNILNEYQKQKESIAEINLFINNYFKDQYTINFKHDKFLELLEFYKKIFYKEKFIIKFIINDINKIIIDEIKLRLLIKKYYYVMYSIEKEQVLTLYQTNMKEYNFNNKTFHKINLEIIKNEHDSSNKSYSTLIKKLTRKNLKIETKIVHSDIECIVFDKAIQSFNSFWKLKELGYKCNKPNFLTKKSFIISFQDRNISKIKNKLELNLANKYIPENFIELKKGYIIEKKYLKKPDFKYKKKDYYTIEKGIIKKDNPNIICNNKLNIKLYSKIKNKVIKQVEIKSGKYKKFDICITFEKKVIKQKEILEKNIKPVSIDLGVKYLFGIFDREHTPTLLDNGYLLHINNKYNELIDNLKSKNDKIKKENDKKLNSLYKNKSNKINGLFNNIVDWFCKRYKSCNTLIIGYNKNWKKKINMGNKTNRKFHEIPYLSLITKLKEKWSSMGKQMITINEAYTSVCDSLSLEKLHYHKNYNGKRVTRGLFISSIGKTIHADINGSINIMRKWYNKMNIEYIHSNLDKVNRCYKVAEYYLLNNVLSNRILGCR